MYSKLVEELKRHLDSITPEELEAEWKELEKLNCVSPTVEEYIESLKQSGLYPEELYESNIS
jgi:hypothetical protein